MEFKKQLNSQSGLADSIPATLAQRLVAALIDGLIVGSITAMLAAVFKGNADLVKIAVANLVVYLGYYVGLQVYLNQTLGKKLIGIRLESLSTSEPPMLSQVVVRQLFGLPFASMFLFLYLIPLLRSDRRGFHDLISGTWVVAQEADRPVKVRFIYVFMSAVVGLVCGGFLLNHLFWNSSFFLQQFVYQLELQGYEINGLSGSLKDGIRVERIAYKQNGFDIEVNEIFFRAKYERLNGIEHFDLKDFAIESARVVIPPDFIGRTQGRALSWFGPKTNESAPNSNFPKEEREKRAFSVTVHNVDVSKVEVVLSPEKKLLVDRIFLANLKVINQGLTLERFWLSSSWLDLDINQFKVNAESIALSKMSRGILKKEFLPNALRKSASFEFKGNISKAGGAELIVTAFDRRVQYQGSLVQGKFALYGFTPAEFLPTAFPISAISLQGEGNPLMLRIDDLRGHLFFQNLRFDKDQTVFRHTNNGVIFELRPQQSDILSVVSGRSLWTLSSSHPRMMTGLLPASGDQSFVTASLEPLAGPPASLPQALPLQKKRTPANLQTPDGLPLKLPAYQSKNSSP